MEQKKVLRENYISAGEFSYMVVCGEAILLQLSSIPK